MRLLSNDVEREVVMTSQSDSTIRAPSLGLAILADCASLPGLDAIVIVFWTIVSV